MSGDSPSHQMNFGFNMAKNNGLSITTVPFDI